MKVWKLASMFLCFILLAITAGAYSNNMDSFSSSMRPHLIYVYKTTLDNIDFWVSVTEGIEAAAQAFDVTYEILGPAEEIDLQGNKSAVHDAIAKRPDMILLTATDYWLLEPDARAVVDAGIPLMTVDSDVNGGWSRSYVGSDNYIVGKQMGLELKKRIPKNGKVAIVGHIRVSRTAIERITGAVDGLDMLGSDRLLDPVYCNNRMVEAMVISRDLIQEHPDLSGIIATNEMAAIGSAMAIEMLGLKDRVSLVSCDNSTQQMSYLEQGIIDATIVQKPFNIGYMSVKLAVELLKNPSTNQVPTFYDTGCQVITHDNMFTTENQKLLFPFRG